MRSILDKVKGMIPSAGGLKPRLGGRPPVAVELSSLGVLAASGKPPVYGFAPLRAGILTPGSTTETHMSAPQPVAEAIRVALEAVHPHKRVVTLLLPDTAIRVFVLDFDALPSRSAEALPLLRFRLRKILPFDVEKAAVSYQTLTASKDGYRVLTTVLPHTMLAEYEAVVRAAGYEPGVVLPAGLAALNTIETAEAALMAHLSPEALTTAIVRGNDLLLFRTLELPAETEQRLLAIQRGISVAMAFFEDKLGAEPQKIFYTGHVEAKEFAQQIGTPALEVLELTPHPTTGAATTLGDASLAGIAGALAGAAR